MTSTPYLNNSIMAYIGANSPVSGYANVCALPGWEGSKLYIPVAGVGAAGGIRQFDIDPNGDETLQKTGSGIGVAGIQFSSGGAIALSWDGVKIFCFAQFANSVQLAEINAADLTLTATFGVPSGGLTPSTATRICAPHELVVMNAGGGSPRELLAACFRAGELDLLQDLMPVNFVVGDVDERANFGTLICAGPAAISSSGPAFALASTGVTTDPVGVYSIDKTGIPLTKIGTFTPAAIDATWTHITLLRGVAYDETDGNLIIGAQTSDAVTHKQYIAKISATTAAVLWTCPINTLTPYSWGFSFSRIRNGTFHYIGSASLAYHIKTSDGTVTTETVTGLTGGNVQYSDDVTNSVIFFGSFIAGGSPPAYLGTYMGTGGHHTVGPTWLRFWFATAGVPPPPPPPPPASGLPAISINRAWSFTLDGHTFYVLDLGSQGTFLYDVITNQWCKFVTAGFGQWDLANGTMWGVRIVGGDLVSTNMWELVPGAVLDNDALEISHVVTGGLSTRSRVFLSVEALRITASIGILDEIVGVTFNLRFSDDNGQSWSDTFVVDLVEGDYGGEIVWRQLGSFCAPGRIFELSDAGGLVRIDGCDAFIDDFDDDSPKPAQ
jgi:hypothetical protein